MSLTKKFAALGAAAAISATGLVAAAGTANAATGTATYTCTATGTIGDLTSGSSFDVPLSLSPATLAGLASGIAAGKAAPVAGSADLTGFLTALGPAGQAGLGAAGTLTASAALPVSFNGKPVSMTINAAPMTGEQLVASKKLTFSGNLPAPAAAGTYAATLPGSFSLAVSASGLGGSVGTVECADSNAAELALGNVVVKSATPPVVNTKLKAAQAQLAKDQKALKAAKKQLKKAKGHKSVVLKKKIAKLNKAIKKAKKAVAAAK